MKIGLSTLFCLGEPFSSMVKRFRKMDVSYVELVDDGLHTLNSRRVKALKKLAESQSFEYTVHAPFADVNIASPSAVLRRAMLKRLEKSIVHAGELDCRVWVFHPGTKTGLSPFYPGEDWEQNLESVRGLLNFAGKQGVKIAIENCPEPYPFLLKSVDDFSKFYQELNAEIGLAFDVGHANLNQQIQGFLTSFSEKIVHVHTHDNRGKEDEHLGVGRGSINWASVAEAVKEIGYDGIITVESVEHVEESLQILRKLLR